MQSQAQGVRKAFGSREREAANLYHHKRSNRKMHTNTARAKTRQTTSSNGRQGKAAQRQQARAEQCYRMMEYLGALPRQEGWAPDVTLEGWRVPSTSDPGVSYTVAHDLAHDLYHCSCAYGQHGGSGCVHELAARRAVWQRRVDYERDQQETHGYNDAYDLHAGAQATSEWED